MWQKMLQVGSGGSSIPSEFCVFPKITTVHNVTLGDNGIITITRPSSSAYMGLTIPITNYGYNKLKVTGYYVGSAGSNFRINNSATTYYNFTTTSSTFEVDISSLSEFTINFSTAGSTTVTVTEIKLVK